MSFAQQFVLAVYDQITELAVIVLPKLIRMGWNVQQRIAAMGVISLVALVQVTFRFAFGTQSYAVVVA